MGAQIDDFLMYDKMLHLGRGGLSMHLGYHKFAEIFNSAPGILTCFTYIPKGEKEVVAPRPGPNRCKFHVMPNNLYHARQVAPHGSQVLSPTCAGIMMQML